MNIASIMAHQDDELMCLGTMLKMQKSGGELAFVCLTDGAAGMAHMPEMPPQEAADIRDTEMKSLASDIGAAYICLKRPDEYLYDTPELRLELIEAIRQVGAELIFTHNVLDYNLDHMTTCSLVRQCAMQSALPIQKTKSAPLIVPPAVFMVEPSGGFEFEPSHWVDITDEMVEKMRLAKYHKSQDEAFIAAFGEGKGIDDWTAQTSKRRGDQCGVQYAEAFLPMRARGLVKAHSVLP
ncbi:MAG: PIG-L family deacetylase [Oscillospiraceae bacterium]|nr:PIG-L family deacetylase [Oscillospiraceae bacterium]